MFLMSASTQLNPKSFHLRLQIEANPWKALEHVWSFSSTLGGLLRRTSSQLQRHCWRMWSMLIPAVCLWVLAPTRPLTPSPVQLLSQSHQGSNRKRNPQNPERLCRRFNFRQENTNFPAYTNTELVYSSLLNSELVSSESRNRQCWWEIECLCVSSGLWGKTCWASCDLKLSVWSDCASRIVGLSYVTAPTLKCLHWD